MKIKKGKGILVMDVVTIPFYPVRTYIEHEIDHFLKLDKKETRQLKKKGLL